MANGIPSWIGPVIGYGIMAVVYFIEGFPLLLGLLMAFKVLRYRDWLAMVAVALSMFLLAGSGDYLYNLTNWNTSRFSPTMNVLSCILIFATPVVLFALVVSRSRWRILWGVGMVLAGILASSAAHHEFVARVARDAEAQRQGLKPLSPRTGTLLVRWWRDDRQRIPKYYLQGHVVTSTPLVLLTDPFSRQFVAQSCTAVAGAYLLAAKDPAELGNVTEIVGLKDCDKRWMQGLAVVERPVGSYHAVAPKPFSGANLLEIVSNPIVRKKFAEFKYDLANFDPAKALTTQAASTSGINVFATEMLPIRSAPNVYPCTGPVVVLSLHDVGNVKTVLPYCTLAWNLFEVNGDLYFAAVTQLPTAPSDEPPMNPDQIYWLLRLDGTELTQLWPTP